MIKVSKACLNLIKEFESLQLKSYHGQFDPPKLWTIGYGCIKYPPLYRNGGWVQPGEELTVEVAEMCLKYWVSQKAQAIDNFLRDDLNNNQFAALISFAYNTGENALRESTLLFKVNSNPNDPTIRLEFNKWVKTTGGVTAPGLVRRRTKEADLYFNKTILE